MDKLIQKIAGVRSNRETFHTKINPISQYLVLDINILNIKPYHFIQEGAWVRPVQ